MGEGESKCNHLLLAWRLQVNALVVDWVTPLIAALVDKRNFAALSFTIGQSVFRYG